ncbi:hypothetical protein ACDZ29_00575 [Peribacillus sp. RS7]|nr:hypothetical protein [Peribacillus sp. Aquil_B8]MCK2016654.1 hypothetical protein [Peribacillus frigoritolerans]
MLISMLLTSLLSGIAFLL